MDDDGQEVYADPKSENLRYTSDVLRWISGAEPILNYNGTTGAEHCPILSGEEEYSGVCEFLQPEAKKRRLGADQIQFLERSFDEDNKLEPERKLRLAKDLGLQPRQVAVWFQNRRARSKTKNLEKEYGALKSRYDGLRADHERILAENSRLDKELMFLKEKLQISEEPVNVMKRKEVSRKMLSESKVASSVRSGVSDADSPHFAEADHRAWVEPVNSSSLVFAAQDEQFWSWAY